MTDISRRTFLTATGGTLAAAWFTADAANLLASAEHAALARQGLPPFRFLSPDDAADIEAATAQIIPTDDTPGAKEARVVHFIDHALATWQRAQRGDFQKGIAELRRRARRYNRAKSFAALTGPQQHAVIASLEKDKHDFFGTLRGATIVGMLSHPDYRGNHEKLGWRMIGFSDQFSWAPPFGWYDAQ